VNNMNCEFAYVGDATLTWEEFDVEDHYYYLQDVGYGSYAKYYHACTRRDYLVVDDTAFCGVEEPKVTNQIDYYRGGVGNFFAPASETFDVTGVTRFKFKTDSDEIYKGFAVCASAPKPSTESSCGWVIESGSCKILEDCCISDNDPGLDYQINMDCKFHYQGDATITSTDFDVEVAEYTDCYDWVMINGKKYCEDEYFYEPVPLEDTFSVSGKTEFEFHSNHNNAMRGFHFCAVPNSEWECSTQHACLWSKYARNKDWGYYDIFDGDCTSCKAHCDNDPNCWAIECGDGYCSWWRTGVCSKAHSTSNFNTCRNAGGIIDSLAKLETWCSANASNCMTCRGEFDGSNCITNPKVIAKCRKFKGNDVCGRIVGCRSVTNLKGKTKCKGKKHGLA